MNEANPDQGMCRNKVQLSWDPQKHVGYVGMYKEHTVNKRGEEVQCLRFKFMNMYSSAEDHALIEAKL